MSKRVLKWLAAASLSFCLNGISQAATFNIINLDSLGEGFNDPTIVSPVTGNSGTTRGQQRLNAFQAAADFWEAILQSNVVIDVEAGMDPLTCDASSAILGFAGPLSAERDFTNAPFTNTWYPQALANSLAGTDLNVLGSDKSDIEAFFNSSIDNNNSCLSGLDWWYGIGGTTPLNAINFFETVLHELAHGLGFLTFVNTATGEKSLGRNDHFMRLLKDFDSGKIWPAMVNSERAASAVDTGDLVWIGAEAKAAAAGVLTSGLRSNGDIRMYAPNPLEPGSSVSHWDTVLTPDELMEPLATETIISTVTEAAFEDMGWNIMGSGGDPGDPGDPGNPPGDPTPPNIVPFIMPLLLD